MDIEDFRQKEASRIKLKDPYSMKLAAGIVHVFPEFAESLSEAQLPPALTTEEYGEISKVGLQLDGFLSRFDGFEKKNNALGILRNRKFRSAYLPDEHQPS